jgi:septum formation protein
MIQRTLYLSSRSPRRRALLAQLGVHAVVLNADVDETPYPDELPEAYVQRLAIAKARAVFDKLPARGHRWVLGADTIVVVDNHILGKPRQQEQALAMLAQLSGRAHRVLSGVALVDGATHYRLSDNQVHFRPINPAEAQAYWATGEPLDKAGGYAIQGVGALFIHRLEGSYSGVMGLPLFETGELLIEAGFEIFR